MAVPAPHEQLRCVRMQRGEDVAALAARTGLRVSHICAIEEGRFGDLPRGIYGRAAIRSFAAAYGLDADAVLADCEALLPRMEDPIGALARMRGIVRTAEQTAAAPRLNASVDPRLRPFAAATVDGAVTGVILLVVSVGAALLARVSVAALSSSAVALFLTGLILGAVYYIWFGGLSGTTFGEYAVGPAPLRRDPRPLTLHAIALRTLAAATADVRGIHRFGVWTGRRLTQGPAARSVLPPAPSPLPLPPRGREEALTWSMSRRASVPPPPLRSPHG
jgi:helix-turn-helix protein